MNAAQERIHREVERLQVVHMAEQSVRSASTKSIHRTTIRRFIRDCCTPPEVICERLVFPEPAFFHWLTAYGNEQSPKTQLLRLCALSSFFETLKQHGLTDTNLISELKCRHGNHSWEDIVRALRSCDPVAALTALRTPATIRGPVFEYVTDYVKLHRSLGKKYRSQAQILRDLDLYLAEQSVLHVSEISVDVMKLWMESLRCNAAVRMQKERLANRFFAYLSDLELLPENPLATTIGGCRIPRSTLKPYIYTHEQIASMLQAATRLPATNRFPLRSETCHTMLAMLYCLGLRHGELRRLTIGDVNLQRGTLMIRETKFHRNRIVPFGPKLAVRLESFLRLRQTTLLPVDDNDPLFVTRWRKPVSNRVLSVVLSRIRHELAITRINGQTRDPRVHDFRHTFAVHRLLRWYRSGVDVQARLPILSTFMGHLNIRSTEVYLTITTELLGEANSRFHRHFGHQFD